MAAKACKRRGGIIGKGICHPPKKREYRGDWYDLASDALGHAGAKHDAEIFRERGWKAHIKTFDDDNWYVYVR